MKLLWTPIVMACMLMTAPHVSRAQQAVSPSIQPTPPTLPTLPTGKASTQPLTVVSPPPAVKPTAPAVSATPSGLKKGEPLILNFNNADIESVARVMAYVTGANVVVDPKVKGTMTLVTEQAVTPQAASAQFISALRLQGYTMVFASGIYKVIPEADAKIQSTLVSVGKDLPAASSNQIQTQVFKLNFENANNLVPILRPLISPNNTINVNAGNNSLVITDYADNIRRMATIIASMDTANATDLEVIPVVNAIASDIAPMILRMLVDSTASVTGADTSATRTSVMADSRSNIILVRAANKSKLDLIKALVAKLDLPQADANGGAGNIYVVYLKNADATKLAVTLRSALSSSSPNTSSMNRLPQEGAPGTAAFNAGSGSQIQADAATNALIITAPAPQYRQLRAVIDKLDSRRAQVYVESLIAEVSSDKAAEFGIQWQGALGQKGDGLIGLLGTNFGAAGSNIINLAMGAASGAVAPSRGMNVGLAPQTNGVYALGFLARFLEETGSGNVLSTPNLLTLDNEEAKIVIGQNVPFVTGQFTNTGASSGGNTVNPFQTIERKDVGLTLKVKPQISENGTVKLVIYQEVSSVLASTANSSNGPTTNKRTIESTVLVDDGAVVVLGGLLQDEYSGNQEKVPGLGDVSFLGNLFKSESRSRKKTNLMVFLRPVVVRDSLASERLSMDRYDLMRTNQQQSQPAPSSTLPINEAPVLPTLPASKKK